MELSVGRIENSPPQAPQSTEVAQRVKYSILRASYVSCGVFVVNASFPTPN